MLPQPRPTLTARQSRVQLERLVRRDGCSPELAEAKVRAQMPLEEKARLADSVLDNSGDRAALAGQVNACPEAETVYGKFTNGARPVLYRTQGQPTSQDALCWAVWSE